MKALTVRGVFCIVLVVLGMVHLLSARGQGLLLFYNHDLTGPMGPYRAGIFRENATSIKGDSVIGAGVGFTAGLFLQGQSTPIATTTFRTTNNQDIFLQPKIVAVPGVPAGERANLVVRVWETSAGNFNNGPWYRGEQAFTTRPLGEAVPVDMGPGFTGFELGFGYPFPAPQLTNANFESPIILNGHVEFGAPPAWTIYNPQNINGSTDTVGVPNATGAEQYSSGAPNGKNAALVHLAGEGSGEAGLQQDFPQYYYGVKANTAYKLQVGVGNPAAGFSGSEFGGVSGLSCGSAFVGWDGSGDG